MKFENLLEAVDNKLLTFSDESEKEVKEFAEDNKLDKRQISLMKNRQGDAEYVIAYRINGVLYETNFTVLRHDMIHDKWSTFDKVENYLSKFTDPDKIIKDYMKYYKDRLSGFQNSEFRILRNSFKVNRELKDYQTLDINSREWETAVAQDGFKEFD